MNLPAIAKTNYGLVKGVVTISLLKDVFISFLGVPYSKPPIGELRFKDPQIPEPWTGIWDATREPTPCWERNQFNGEYLGSEDCLYLNLFTRNTLPIRLKPVIVFIHGGAFMFGSSSLNFTGPDYIMKEDVVLVDFTKTNPNDLKFSELKVRIQPSNQRQEDNFHRFKTINWWCQSYLVKVQKIIVGLRTQAGIVDKLEYMNVDSMPRMNERYWSDTICIDFLNRFLSMVKELLNDVDCPHTVYRFNYDPSTSSSIQCDILEGPNECSFIPSWYINEVQKFKSK